MSFNITFNKETKKYDKPVMVLDIVGNNKDYVCAYVNKRVRELTYMVDKDSEIIPLTCKDRDAKPSYEASLRFLVAMAMHNIRPELDVWRESTGRYDRKGYCKRRRSKQY